MIYLYKNILIIYIMANLINYKNQIIEESSSVIDNLSKPKISKLIMTVYEFNQIIGLRTMQLSLGAIPFINTDKFIIKNNIDLRQISIQEFKEGKIPYMIKRPLPNNKYEYIRIKDLDLAKIKYLY